MREGRGSGYRSQRLSIFTPTNNASGNGEKSLIPSCVSWQSRAGVLRREDLPTSSWGDACGGAVGYDDYDAKFYEMVSC